MKTLKVILFVVLVAVGAGTVFGQTKSAAVLLREGLYAEQTEGDLEKAIGIYEQVLVEAGKAEKVAAKATYQLGMCYLKKGDSKKAAEYFQEIITKYPKQTVLLKRAKQQLQKVKPVQPGSAPVIVKTNPVAFSNNVSPELSEITVTFDQPMMDESWSWTGGGDTYPQTTGKIHYDRTKTTCTLPVKLAAGKVYWIGINSPSHNNFKTPDRVSAPWYIIVFATKGTDGRPTVIPWDMLSRAKQINDQAKAAARKTAEQPEEDLSISFYSPNVNDAGELLKLFNLNLPSDAQTYQYRQEVKDGQLIGTIKARTADGKTKVIEMINKSPYLKLVKKAVVETQTATNNKDEKLKAEDLIAQGWKLWGQRKLAEAEEKFQQAVNLNPEADGAWQGLGWAQLNQGKKLNAKKSFEKCVEINPQNSAALNGLGWITHGQGDISGAIALWERAVDSSNGTATASLSGLTQVYMERKEYDKAEKYYQIWIKAEPNNKEAIGGLEKSRTLQGKPSVSEAEINSLIKQLGEKEEKPFTALNKLIDMGEPAVEQLIAKMMKKHNSNWQFPKALGGIGDKRAVGPLIEKWKDTDTSPINDVIVEALSDITGKNFGKDLGKWQQWWNEVGEFYTPEDTIRNFMADAVELDKDRAMAFVASDSHDYEDIKETFESSENPFNIMWRKLDSSMPSKIIKANVIDNMCRAIWRVTFKEDFNFGKTAFKAGDTFDLDGNLRKYDDKWFITGI